MAAVKLYHLYTHHMILNVHQPFFEWVKIQNLDKAKDVVEQIEIMTRKVTGLIALPLNAEGEIDVKLICETLKNMEKLGRRIYFQTYEE